MRASCDTHNNNLGMEGFPLALVAENTLIPELLVGGNLECTKRRFGIKFQNYILIPIRFLIPKKKFADQNQISWVSLIYKS